MALNRYEIIPSGRTAGHLSGSDRATRCPTGKSPALCLERSRRAPALWRRRAVQLDRLAAGTRARLDGELSGAGLDAQSRGLPGAVDADPGAEHPAARAVATRLMRCQSETLAHHASTLASGAAAAAFMMRGDRAGSGLYRRRGDVVVAILGSANCSACKGSIRPEPKLSSRSPGASRFALAVRIRRISAGVSFGLRSIPAQVSAAKLGHGTNTHSS